MRISRTGRVTVFTGASAMGQGLGTALAQIAASELGVDVGKVKVVAGDTAGVSLGLGGFASRQTVTAGSSVLLAAKAVADKAKKVACHVLEAAEHDLELRRRRGARRRRAAACRSSSPRSRASCRARRATAFPPGVDPGLEANVNHRTDALCYANGCHVAEVEVDVETGEVKILRYVALQDSGVLINPMMVEGQIHGGVAHGIGNALYEWMGYDDGAPAGDHDVRRLSAADRDRSADADDALQGDALAAQSARRQGRRRGRHHPGRRGADLGGRGRAVAVRRAHRPFPADADGDRGDDPGRAASLSFRDAAKAGPDRINSDFIVDRMRRPAIRASAIPISFSRAMAVVS